MGQGKHVSRKMSIAIATVVFAVGVFLTIEMRAPREDRLLPAVGSIHLWGPVIAAVGLGMGLRQLRSTSKGKFLALGGKGSFLRIVGSTLLLAGLGLIVAVGIMTGWAPEAGMIWILSFIFLLAPGALLIAFGHSSGKSGPGTDERPEQ